MLQMAFHMNFYDEEIALEKIGLAEEVLKWVEKELKK
jgi:hypothetical protein